MKFITLLCFFIGSFAHADSISKHPRVAELEDALRAEASSYLRSRFPDQPFLVSVSVDPIRRATGKTQTPGESELPYFDATDSEITDEWDDPNANLHQLLLRTTKVSVEISLSENVSDGERLEVRDSLYQSLHLIPARDEIKIETRKWNSVKSYTYYFLTGIAIALFFLIGFSVVQRYGYKRLAQSLSEVKINSTGSGGGGGGTATLVAAPAAGSGGGGDSGVGQKPSQMEFSDPLQARELMHQLVVTAEKAAVFPTLSTMVYLDQVGKKDPAVLGSILQELPEPLQKRIFAYGTKNHWFEAILNPGHFGMEQVNLFQQLVRGAAFAQDKEVEEMIIRVWRLDEEIENFVRGLDRNMALSILYLFPKDKAIQYARKALPGAWADLLDPSFQVMKFTSEQCKFVTEAAEKVKPLLDFSELNHYRQLNEVSHFLKVASPEEEKEVYQILKPTSRVHQERPPFYVVLEATEADLSKYVPLFTPQQWATALFNISRATRVKVQKAMHEKQRFLFTERMRKLDQTQLDPIQVGQMREMMARKYKEFLEEKNKVVDITEKPEVEAEGDADSTDEDQAA